MNLVCDGRSHCSDGSDEVGCPTVAAKTSKTTPLKCRLGSKACRDGSECVLLSHVCDGEKDCRDGSDEKGCDHVCKPGEKVTTPIMNQHALVQVVAVALTMLKHRFNNVCLFQ